MRITVLLAMLTSASQALACDVLALQGSVGLVVGAGQPVLPSLEAGLNCGLSQADTKPVLGAQGRLMLQRDLRLLGQLGLSAGVLMPGNIAAQLEAGLLGDNGVVRPTVGASVWAAPLEPVSPRLGVGWTHFQRDGETQDWLSLAAGVAAVGSLRPTEVFLTK